jgi:hypothetical protein
MKRRKMLASLPLFTILGACGSTGKPQSDRELKGMGMVIKYDLAPGAAPKSGVEALTDAGNRLFGPSTLTHRNPGTSSMASAKMSFPRRARITWRENTEPGKYWTTGTVVGDYTVEVLSRLPDELFSQVKAGPRRAIVLWFRLADDGVQFAWEIQVGGGQGGYQYIHHGGDF